jgi:starvation-inducible DNA-binding protein
MQQEKIMEEVHSTLKIVLADTFTMYMKTHSFHWNVIGPNFSEYHAFFGTLYEELHAAIDLIAEQIRAANSFAPSSLDRIKELTRIEESDTIPAADRMFQILINDNNIVLDALKQAYDAADKAEELGLANFLQDRMDIHKKHGWMLRATAGMKS